MCWIWVVIVICTLNMRVYSWNLQKKTLQKFIYGKYSWTQMSVNLYVFYKMKKKETPLDEKYIAKIITGITFWYDQQLYTVVNETTKCLQLKYIWIHVLLVEQILFCSITASFIPSWKESIQNLKYEYSEMIHRI